jgi:hypothetical protein
MADPLPFLSMYHLIDLFLLPLRNLLNNWIQISLSNWILPVVESRFFVFLPFAHEPFQRRTATLLICFLQFK